MWSRFTCIELLLAICLMMSLTARAASLETALMPGKVIQGHAKYEHECKQCHIPFDKEGQPRLCLDCHKPVAADVAGKTGFHGRQKEQDCRACHSEHKGRGARIAEFDRDKFDHARTDFPLRGGHAAEKVKCSSCHKPGARWREAPQACQSCHRKDDVHKGQMGEKCSQCHNEQDWKDAKFDHDKTRFLLRGGHEKAKCADCHANRKYKPTPRECVACHRQDDQEKAHKGRYGAKCETCHLDRGWKILRFDHDRDTKYPLRGKHAEAKCDNCHKGQLYKDKLPQACVSCHRADDVHKGSQGQKCESCHNERSWKTSGFDHDRDTKFLLRGKHREAKCETCHRPGPAGVKQKLETACASCHRKDDGDKGHKGRYGLKCDTCHGEKLWKDIHFNHDRDTKYLLRGKHRQVKCDDCHKGRLYEDKLASDCLACHLRNDVHKGQLGKRCDTCHREQSWRETWFDHGRSRFPLTGSHVRTECKKCHATQLYRDTSSRCLDCHAKEDVHKKRLGPRCETCHNTRVWKSWDYDHDRKTRFPLDGGHAKLNCLDCHQTPVEKEFHVARTCIGCHVEDDVHEGGFGPQCERCHTTGNFADLKPGVMRR